MKWPDTNYMTRNNLVSADIVAIALAAGNPGRIYRKKLDIFNRVHGHLYIPDWRPLRPATVEGLIERGFIEPLPIGCETAVMKLTFAGEKHVSELFWRFPTIGRQCDLEAFAEETRRTLQEVGE